MILGVFGEDCGDLWTVLECDGGFSRFRIDFQGFWSILGEFWGAMLQPVWRPRRMKIGKKSIHVFF